MPPDKRPPDYSYDHPGHHDPTDGIFLKLSRKLKRDDDLEYSRYKFRESIYVFIKETAKKGLDPGRLDVEASTYPLPYVFAQLSEKVYTVRKSKQNLRDYEKRLDLPGGWRVLTTVSNTRPNNGYFGAAFWLPERQQVVIAHRGTDPYNMSHLYTDLKGIVYNNYVAQINSACTFASQISEALKELEQDPKFQNPRFQLFFTGHSLGGWLAQITTFATKYLQLVDTKFQLNRNCDDNYHTHTVVFDSPGCKEMLSKMKKCFDVRYFGRSVSSKTLDITTYLSAPNRINCCNSHLGTIYRIFPDFSDMGTIAKHSFGYSIHTHDIKKISRTFSDETDVVVVGNETKELMIHEVADWPTTGKLTREEEYKSFFKWAKHFNKYHPDAKDEYFRKELERNGGCTLIHYQTIDFDDRRCSVSLFSQNELNMLLNWRSLRRSNANLDILNEFVSKNGLVIEEGILVNFKIDTETNTFCCDSKDDLNKTIRLTKHIMRWFPEQVFQVIREQTGSVPSACEAVYKLESDNYIEAFVKTEIDFEDTIGLADFLKSSDQRIMWITTTRRDGVLEATRLYSILKQIRNRNMNRGDYFETYFRDKLQTFLSWSQLLNLVKFSDINSILKSDSSFCNLLLIDYVVEVSDENRILSELLANAKKFQTTKIVFITSTSSSPTEFNVFDDAPEILKKISDSKIKFDDLTERSQFDLLNKRISIFQDQHISLGKLLGLCMDKEKLSENSLSKLNRILDLETLINISITKESIEVNSNQVRLSDLDVLYRKIHKLVPTESLVRFLSEDRRQFNITKSIVYMINISRRGHECNINADTLIDLLKITEDQKDFIRRAVVDKTILITTYEDVESNLDAFRKTCHQNSDKRIYWFDALSTGIYLHQLYDSDFYVDRQFISHVQIDRKIGEVLTPPTRRIEFSEQFIFSNVATKNQLIESLAISRNKVDEFLKNENVITSPTFESGRQLFASKCEENSPVHWLDIETVKGQQERIMWQNSIGPLDKLRKYIKEDGAVSRNEQRFCESRDRVIIFADVPGMGKSTTLVSLSRQIPSGWVLLINLNDCQKSLRKLSAQFHLDEVVDFLISNSNTNSTDPLVRGLLLCCLEYDTLKRVYLLFDGFDEIKEDIQQAGDPTKVILIRLLQFLKEKTVAHVWVTTRKHASGILENSLSVFATKFEEVGRDQQQDFYKMFWLAHLCVEMNGYGDLEQRRMELYANTVFERAEKVFGKEISDFMGIPLQMRMLAEVLQPKSDLFTRESDDEDIDFPINNVLKLYKSFIELKYRIYCTEKMGFSDSLTGVTRVWFLEPIIKKHRYLGFRQLFPNEYEEFLGKKYILFDRDRKEFYDEEIELNRFGLIQSNCLFDHFEFIHQTFAEYFSADLIHTWLMKPQGRHPQYPPLEEFLLTKILLEPNYKVVRLFLNCHLSQSHIHSDTTRMYGRRMATLWLKKKQHFFNKEKQTALHVLVEEQSQHIVEFILGALQSDETEGKSASMLSACDKNGDTALFLATKNSCNNETNDDIIVRLILESLMSSGSSETQQVVIRTTVFKRFNDDIDKVVEHLSTYVKDCPELNSIYWDAREKRALIADFLAAAKKGDQESLERHLSEAGDDNSRTSLLSVTDCDGMSALLLAAKSGHLETVQYLVNQGSNLAAQDSYEMSAVAWAAKHGHLEIVEDLVKMGADRAILNRNGISPLQHAAKSGHLRIVEYFVEKGEDLNWKDKFGMTALSWAAKGIKEGHLEVVEYLVDHQADMKILDRHHMSALQIAIKANNWSVVEFLVKKGAAIKDSSLLRVIKAGKWNIVNLLINQGANVNDSDRDGVTALQQVMKIGKWEIVEVMIGKGARLDVTDQDGRSPLQQAIKARRWNTAELMVFHGADVNVIDQDGKSPLQHVISSNISYLAKYFVEKGAKLTNLSSGHQSS